MELRTDIEFENKIPPLSADELMRLQDSIIAEGRLISPIVVWNGIIVDGHNRYRFIQHHPEIEYEIYEKNFDDRNEAIAWICKNQLGRRNLTPEQKKYLIGKQYEAEKQTLGGDRKSAEVKSSGQNDQMISEQTTAKRIAEENGIGEKTVRRAAQYSRAVDLADEAVPGTKNEILSGAVNATDAEIMCIAKAAPEERPALVEKLKTPKEPKPYTYKKEYYVPNPSKDVSLMQKISEDMLAAQGKSTVEDALYELDAAADSLIFRWKMVQEKGSHLSSDEVFITGTRKLIAELTEYLQSVEARLNEYTG